MSPFHLLTVWSDLWVVLRHVARTLCNNACACDTRFMLLVSEWRDNGQKVTCFWWFFLLFFFYNYKKLSHLSLFPHNMGSALLNSVPKRHSWRNLSIDHTWRAMVHGYCQVIITVYLHQTPAYSNNWNNVCYVTITVDHGTIISDGFALRYLHYIALIFALCSGRSRGREERTPP